MDFYCAFLLISLLANVADGSLFCPYSAYPSSDAEFETLRVEVHAEDDPIQLGQPIYRLKRSGSQAPAFGQAQRDESAFRPVSGEQPFRLFTSAHSGECPKRGCLHELALAEPRVPGTLFYHTDTIMGKLIPPGFLTVEANPRLYCSIVRDDCGADVPIFRHFKMVGPRVYYAYSTSPDVEIGANFTREPLPMCFGWSAARPAPQPLVKPQKHPAAQKEDFAVVKLLRNSVAVESEEEREEKDTRVGDECAIAGNDAGVGNDTVNEAKRRGSNSDGFAMLTAYDNQKLGTLRDHIYTTQEPPAEEYKKERELGLVMVDPTAANCSTKCLVKLGQMLANRSDGLGIFPMRDHKLVLMGKESADTYYTPTGEAFWCARRAGQCGAELPLRRYWHLAEMDTLLTVNSTGAAGVPVLSIPTWDGVLCYIWTAPEKN